MSKRVSHSFLDPWISPPLKWIYHRLPIPAALPPEAIVVMGHLLAAVGGIGFAFSTTFWWGGMLAALGVAGNHSADVVDGTHARATGQCRNGGELLDHFTDPLSFCYYLVGWAVSCEQPYLGVVAVICLYATAVLTNIKAKMIGEFTLSTFGPTEFKSLLVVYGIFQAVIVGGNLTSVSSSGVALWSFVGMIVIGLLQLATNLVLAIREVNRDAVPPDTTEWETRQDS